MFIHAEAEDADQEVLYIEADSAYRLNHTNNMRMSSKRSEKYPTQSFIFTLQFNLHLPAKITEIFHPVLF